MLCNLNHLSFREFGEILTSPFISEDDRNEERIVQSRKEFVRFTCCPAYLEHIHGMAVVAVSVDGTNSIHRFYLDKPVVIRPGIWFCVLILGERGCVRCVTGKSGGHHKKMLPKSLSKSLFSPLLTVSYIYTLFYQEQKKGFLFPGEQHKPYELVYVDKGLLHSVAGGKNCLLKQGEMVLYTPEQWHMQYAEQECPVSFITISFDMECSYAELLGNRKFRGGSNVKRLLARMLLEQQSSNILRDDMLQCSLKEILIDLLRYEDNIDKSTNINSTSTAMQENRIIEAAQRYVTDNLDKRLSVEMLARGIHMSTSYMSALFRKHLGISPSKYISRVKLAESKWLIQNGNYSLTEISHRLGYATLQHFSRSFKSGTGITPSEYAKALR